MFMLILVQVKIGRKTMNINKMGGKNIKWEKRL